MCLPSQKCVARSDHTSSFPWEAEGSRPNSWCTLRYTRMYEPFQQCVWPSGRLILQPFNYAPFGICWCEMVRLEIQGELIISSHSWFSHTRSYQSACLLCSSLCFLHHTHTHKTSHFTLPPATPPLALRRVCADRLEQNGCRRARSSPLCASSPLILRGLA